MFVLTSHTWVGICDYMLHGYVGVNLHSCHTNTRICHRMLLRAAASRFRCCRERKSASKPPILSHQLSSTHTYTHTHMFPDLTTVSASPVSSTSITSNAVRDNVGLCHLSTCPVSRAIVPKYVVSRKSPFFGWFVTRVEILRTFCGGRRRQHLRRAQPRVLMTWQDTLHLQAHG